MAEGVLLDYCYSRQDLSQKLREEYPNEYDALMKIPTQSWVLAGGFISYLAGLTTAFDDIDVFIFDASLDVLEYFMGGEDWRREGNFDYTHLGKMFITFTHKECKLQVLIILDDVKYSTKFLVNVFCYMDHEFDASICKTAFHPPSSTLINIDFGENTFHTEDRRNKYIRRCKFTSNPKTLKFLCLVKISKNYSPKIFLNNSLILYMRSKLL